MFSFGSVGGKRPCSWPCISACVSTYNMLLYRLILLRQRTFKLIITQTELPELRQELAGKTIAYTCGTFDLLHIGHIEFLEWCSEQADVLVVGLHSDARVQAAKGPSRPVITEGHRLGMLDALRMVDYEFIVEGSDLKAVGWIKAAQDLHPDVCILGPDWADLEIQLWKEMVPEAEIRVSPARKGHSTSAIVDKIAVKA